MIFPQDQLSSASNGIAIGAINKISRMLRYCLSWVFHGQEDYAVRKLGKSVQLRNIPTSGSDNWGLSRRCEMLLEYLVIDTIKKEDNNTVD